MYDWDSKIQFLPGVGPKRASLLQKELEVETISDLLHLYPFRYIDRSKYTQIADVRPDLAWVQVKARVASRNLISMKHLSVIIEDESGTMEIVFFKGNKYIFEKLVPGSEFVFFGKPSLFNGKLNMVHPEIDAPGSINAQGTLTGVYPSTEKLKNGGITGKVMLKLIAAALEQCLPHIEETLPDYVIAENRLVPLRFALQNIHFPKDQDSLAKASYRLKFEELFFLQLSLLKQKYVRSRAENGIPMPKVGSDFNACFHALPYELT